MATTFPFAYNTGTTINGTLKLGSLSIGLIPQDYSANPGGVKWWMGPDDDIGYVIAHSRADQCQPTHVGGVFAGMGFNRSAALTSASFLIIANHVASQRGAGPFSTSKDADMWLTTNNLWSSYAKYVTNISEDNTSTFQLTSDGQAWGWGYNSNGQLGDNSLIAKSTPVSVLGAKKTFCQIISNGATMVIDNRGLIWGWGLNTNGELGNNTQTSQRTPVSILGVKKTFCDIKAGIIFMLGLDKNGQIWSWGDNSKGQLGISSTVCKSTPVSILGTKKTFCTISANSHVAFGLDKNGQAWGWGYNGQGQLGNNSTICKSTPVSILGAKKTFCFISIDYAASIGLDYKGQVWGWGYNNQGQLGINSNISQSTPVSILGAKKTFCKISTRQHSAGALDYKGQLWGWGYNNKGQLGVNSLVDKSTPVSILGAKKTFCKIYFGVRNSFAIDVHNQLWGWGYNNNTQIGIELNNKCSPISVLGTNKTFCNITLGKISVYGSVIDYKGQLWSWGINTYGNLGDNSTVDRSTPISILGAKKTFCKISSGQYTASGIDKNGQVWSWGNNGPGSLGNNTDTIHQSTPVSILGAKKTFCYISLNSNSGTISLDYKGQIWSWGYNGSLGNNSNINQSTPVSILGAKKTFCYIAMGGINPLAIDKNGQVWSWGWNNFGQLGNNSTVCQSTPVSILGTKKTFCKIDGSASSSHAIDYKGQVWGWGYNNYGQLGNNTIASKMTPISILGAKKTFCQISGGNVSTYAIDYKGQVWGWGDNFYGQLGIGTRTLKSTPVSILGVKKTFCKISAGLSAVIALDNNNKLWSWGSNSNTVLVNYINWTTPVRIYTI